jgi:hypothetical protein
MDSVVIVNQEDVETFAKEQGRKIPVDTHREWFERAIVRHVAETGEGLWRSLSLLADLDGFEVARAFTAGETIVRFSPSATLCSDSASVSDWLADLEPENSLLAGKLGGVAFSEAVEMSREASAAT